MALSERSVYESVSKNDNDKYVIVKVSDEVVRDVDEVIASTLREIHIDTKADDIEWWKPEVLCSAFVLIRRDYSVKED